MKTNKERLACLETTMEYIKEAIDNHLAHHSRYTFLALGALFSATGSLIVGLILLLIK